MRCPRCDSELSGQPAKCDQCHGCWVSAADVKKTVKSDVVAWTDGGASKIDCPECHKPMQAITLRGVQLDRCAHHGVWFDIGEITDMLRKTGKIGPEEAAPQDKPSGKSVAGGIALGVGEVLLEVVGGVIEVVGEVIS